MIKDNERLKSTHKLEQEKLELGVRSLEREIKDKLQEIEGLKLKEIESDKEIKELSGEKMLNKGLSLSLNESRKLNEGFIQVIDNYLKKSIGLTKLFYSLYHKEKGNKEKVSKVNQTLSKETLLNKGKGVEAFVIYTSQIYDLISPDIVELFEDFKAISSANKHLKGTLFKYTEREKLVDLKLDILKGLLNLKSVDLLKSIDQVNSEVNKLQQELFTKVLLIVVLSMKVAMIIIKITWRKSRAGI